MLGGPSYLSKKVYLATVRKTPSLAAASTNPCMDSTADTSVAFSPTSWRWMTGPMPSWTLRVLDLDRARVRPRLNLSVLASSSAIISLPSSSMMSRDLTAAEGKEAQGGAENVPSSRQPLVVAHP